MASTYSPLKIELIGTGEQAGTWGTTTNTNLGTALEEAITGRVTATFPSDATYTLPYLDSNGSQIFRNLVLNVVSSGNLSVTRDLIIPAIEKQYFIENNTSGGQSIRVKTAAGTGVTIPNGKIANIFCNGTDTRLADDFVNITGGAIDGVAIGASTASTGAFTTLSATTLSATTFSATNASLTNALPVGSGGTGVQTLTANNVLLGNGTSAIQGVAPGTSGNLLTSNGTTWTSAAPPTSFITGMILMWSGAIATIPSGWALCNGLNGTPDLRDRFIIGASQDSSGTARTNVTGSLTQTGGTKDAIVVSHTHTATTSSAGSHTHRVALASDGGSPLSTLTSDNYVARNGSDYNLQGVATGSSVGISGTSGTHTHPVTVDTAGSSGTNQNLPPYYALAFIMKL